MVEQDDGTICAMPRCHRSAHDGTPICDHCVQRMRADFSWLAANLPELENYRINRAYGRITGLGATGGIRAVAPLPLRETLADMLYNRDDTGMPGLQPLLYEWARTLAVNLPETTGPQILLGRIRNHHRLLESPATPVYADELHTQVKHLRRFMEPVETRIVLGPCPAKSCAYALAAPRNAETVVCPRCGSHWDTGFLLAGRAKRIARSPRKGTQAELRALLDSCGIHVNANTLKSWIHRRLIETVTPGLPPHERKYMLADVYRLAANPEPDETDNTDETATGKENQ